jgi:hypothetical protein
MWLLGRLLPEVGYAERWRRDNDAKDGEKGSVGGLWSHPLTKVNEQSCPSQQVLGLMGGQPRGVEHVKEMIDEGI